MKYKPDSLEIPLHTAGQARSLVFAGALWANSAPYEYEILDFISSQTGLQGLHIVRKSYRDHDSMIADVYRYDSVPTSHLISKAQYLRTFPATALFFFFSLPVSLPTAYGSPPFRNQEYEELRELKWKIRSIFNPRDKEGEMSHEHVVHISDTLADSLLLAKQLKVLNLVARDKPFQETIAGVQYPWHLGRLKSASLMEVNLQDLRIRLVSRVGPNPLVRIEESPHFKSINDANRSPYDSYVRPLLGYELKDWHTWSKFSRLVSEISARKNPIGPIIAEPIGESLVVLDGAHRCSILLQLGEDKARVLIPNRGRNC